MENGFVKVVSPIDDTPAARAGLLSGDFITHIDGESVLGLSLSEAVDKMRGPVGSEINITISRAGSEEPFDVKITRDVIKIRAVRARVEGDVGILRITTFNEQTFANLEEAIAEVKEKIGADKVSGYIVDLRNNPGGLLNQAIEVADETATAAGIRAYGCGTLPRWWTWTTRRRSRCATSATPRCAWRSIWSRPGRPTPA